MFSSEWAKSTRKALGWTQEQLAAEARVAESVVSAFERGKGGSVRATNAIHNALKAAIGDDPDHTVTAK